MSQLPSAFVEVCIYEVKPEKTPEFEQLLQKVANHHRSFPGVRDVRYIKRTHRPRDFASARKGVPPSRLTRTPTFVTYVLYWELDDELAHGKATESGLEQFLSEFRRCLVTPPKVILGERIL